MSHDTMGMRAGEDAAVSAMQSLLARQRAAYRAQPMPGLVERREHLKRFKDALLRHKDRLAAAESQDFGGHSLDEVMIAEIFPLVSGLNDAIKHVGKWMKPSRRHLHPALLPSRARVMYQPLGVIGIVTPWNYPLLLSLGPLTNVIAAGNRAMIKLAAFSPAMAVAMRAMLAEAFAEDHVAIVTGNAAEFSRLRFDHLVFTGSSAVGREVMRTAAENLVPVTLELGGKSPVIIGDDAPVAEAAERICWGKSLKSGQSCTSLDYVLCPRGRVDEFVQAYRNSFSRMFPTLRDNPDRTSIINDKQYQRLLHLLADAKAKGAQLVELNPANEDLSGTRKLPTTLVLGASEEMELLHQEIFGPILPVLPYDQLNDALNYINDRPRPLALYLFSYDSARQRHVLEQTHAGIVALNDTMTQTGMDDIPFGGIGESGMGHYHGYEGFLTFSKAKGVFAVGRFNGGKLIYAPFGRWFHRLFYWLFLR
jgi:coniferyl-aldehyde dehydrogenase